VTDDDALRSADQRARRQALDVTRSFIVQAPAGSGKTELLIQRYLRLLAVVDEPEEVLAITFTRKAAAEMRQRVVAALDRAAAGEAPAAEHERLTYESALVVLERDRALGWDLVDVSRRMRIQTLDSLCAGIVQTLPVTSGFGGTAAVVQDAEAEQLYRSAALATLDWLTSDAAPGEAVGEVLSHLDNNTGSYVAYLAAMLRSRDQWLDIVGSGDAATEPDRIRRRLEANIADLVGHALKTAQRRLDAVAPRELPSLARYAADNLVDAGEGNHPATVLRDLTAIPGSAPDELPRWRGLAELLLTGEGGWRRRLTRTQGFPPKDDGQKDAWLSVIDALAGDDGLVAVLHGLRNLPMPRYDDRQWQVLIALFRVLPLAVSELMRVFAEQGASDHVEIALAASVALGRADEPSDLALMLDYRLRHLLVDEMQDTSIAQYRLLETLTAGWEPGDGRSFFCVGDPMQSIYRFRNAEVGQFVRAWSQGLDNLPLEPLTLRRNFRSGEHLVHWFNRVFNRVLTAEDDPATGAVRYSESVPVESLRDSGRIRLHPRFGADTAAEAVYTTDLVADCLNGTPQDESVAVLVRSRTQLPELLAGLRQRGIAYNAVEIDRLTDLPELIDLIALTRALAHAQDRAAWLALLRSPLVGLCWTDLHQLVRNAPGASVPGLLADAARIGRLSAGASERLREFLAVMQDGQSAVRLRSLRHRVESAWFGLGGPGCLDGAAEVANAYRYLEVLESLESGGTLEDPAHLHSRLEDVRVSSAASDKCRLQVMTMHKAKGLQFDHVVLPSLGRFTTRSSPPVLNWLNAPADAGGSDLVLSPVGPGYVVENDPLHRYIESSRAESDRLELDRLLYVACTRARRSLHLVAAIALDGEKDEIRAPDSRSMLSRLWPALEDELRQQYCPGAEASTKQRGSEAVLVAPVLRRISGDWRPPPAPALPSRAAGPFAGGDAARYEVPYDWVGAAARDAGTIVHRWLHRLARAEERPRAEQVTDLDSTTRAWARWDAVSESSMDEVTARVRNAISSTLDDPRGRWVLYGLGHAELPLTGIRNGRIESIVIDRVRIEGDTHWIIDYKTSSHEGGDLEGFIEQEIGRYREQLERYADLYRAFSGARDVRAALYFPLMRSFRPVEFGQHGSEWPSGSDQS